MQNIGEDSWGVFHEQLPFLSDSLDQPLQTSIRKLGKQPSLHH